MKIFTYLPPPDASNMEATIKLVLEWQTSWQKNGFETHVLNERDGRDWLMAMLDRGGLYSSYRVQNQGWQLTKGDMGRAGADKVLSLFSDTDLLLFAKPAGYARLITSNDCLVRKEGDPLLQFI